jgi:two-component system response regulator FixJ
MTPSRMVYIVDDNVEFLQSARWWLEGAGYEVEGYDNPREALDALRNPRSDACLLLDVRMPGMSGLDVHDTLRQRGSQLPIIYMTGHGDVPLAVEAMRKGAVTFIEKPFADEALESALAMAFERRPKADTPLTLSIMHPASEDGMTTPSEEAFQRRLSKLTSREREVIDWVVKGKLNKVIADLLGISIKTVELHRKNAMSKLQARSVIDLTKLMVTGRVS